MPTATAASDVLVSCTEIAEMAQVQRPVVTTWRRRHPDFPAPVGDAARSPRFDGHAVVQWLTTHRLGNAEPHLLAAEIALHALDSHAEQFGSRRLIELVSAALCLRKLADAPLLPPYRGESPRDAARGWAGLLARAERLDAEDEYLLSEFRAQTADALPLVHLADDLVEAAYTPARALERLLARRDRLAPAELVTDRPADALVRLMVHAADPVARLGADGLVAADPHATAGDLLVAVTEAVGDRGQVAALGAEPQEWLARLARRRLLLAGVDDLRSDVQIGVDLEEAIADPHLVLTQLPYSAAESRRPLTALEQVERVADLLRAGSTGVVLGPASALVDRIVDARAAALRADLIRSGVVEAVVALPGGAVPHRPGYRTALWVLTRDPVPAARGFVLLADLSAQPLTDHVCARAAEDVVLWRAEGRRLDGHEPRYGRVVPVADLVARPKAALTPPGPPVGRLLARPVVERAARITEAQALLEQQAEQARAHADRSGPLRAPVVRRTGPAPSRTTLGALIAAGRVRRVPGHRLDPGDVGAVGHHRVLGAADLSPAIADGAAGPPLDDGTSAGGRWIDRLVLASRYERTRFTEPGDVVYTTVPRLRAVVDHAGFALVEFPARALRVVPTAERPLTPGVLAALITAASDTARSPGAVRPPKRIDDFVVPDLDPDDVTRLDALLTEVELRRDQLRAQRAALDCIELLTVAGIVDGTLTIDH